MKKKELFVRIIAAVLTGILALGVVITPALAATVTGGTMTFQDVVTVDDDYVDIPNIDINYEMTAGTAVAGSKTTPSILAGITPENVTVSQASHLGSDFAIPGGETKRVSTIDVTIDFSGVSFPTPGVYRYIITPSCVNTDVTVAAARTVDVYVINDDENGGLKIGSYHFHDGAGAKATDMQHTYNKVTQIFTLSNKVTGNQGDKSKDITYSLNITTTNTLIGTKTKADGSTENVTLTVTDGTCNTTIKLKNGESFEIKGLVKDDIVNVTQEDLETDGYTTTHKINGGSAIENISTGNMTIAAETISVEYENNKNVVTPTGVMISLAPYATMLGIAVYFMFFVIAKRKKEVEEDEV